MKSRLLVPLLLLFPAFYCGGKLARNYLEDTITANRDKPLLALQAQQEKEFELFKQRQAKKLAADNERTAEQCRSILAALNEVHPDYWKGQK
jgi:hypothetical protein